MSQLILDEQLDARRVFLPLQRWIKVQRLHELRPGELLLDERVPEVLLTLKQPTFVTIDHTFRHRRLCHPDYCILYFPLAHEKQRFIPGMLRTLFRLPEFRTRAARMGKVAHVTPDGIDYWQFQISALQHLDWPRPSRKRRK